MGRIFVLVTLVALSLTATTHAFAYTGTLTTSDGLTGGLRGTGTWFPVTITWDVSWTGTAWSYIYDVTATGKNISHFIVEASPSLVESDISTNWKSVPDPLPDDVIVMNNTSGNGNDTIPGDLWGIRFNPISEASSWHVEFTTLRMPVWGDFYVRDGNPQRVLQSAWNEGFLTADPTDPLANGSILNHILVPDTRTVPEPGGLLAIATGLISLIGLSTRRFRR